MVIAERNLVRLPRSPDLLLAFTVQPIMFVLLFAYVFGGAISTPGYSYIDFLIPGIIVQNIAFGGFVTAVGLNEDLSIAGLRYLNPDKEIVTYCYTGQTSSIISAWLDVLGYKSRSLLFGANGIVHSKMVNSDVDSAKKKSWQGEGSGSGNSFQYATGPN